MSYIIDKTDSILLTIKELLGINSEDTSFDVDITTYINSTFIDLQQIGVGPDEGFFITGETETWDQFTTDSFISNSIPTYIYLKVKLIFDPNISAATTESFNSMIDRLEWRLNLSVELNKDRKETIQNG